MLINGLWLARYVNCHTNVTRKFGVCGVYLERLEKFKPKNKHRNSHTKKIGKNKMKKIILLIAIGSVLNLDYARASVVLANWTFESYTATSTAATGPALLAEAGLGAGVAVATGVHASSSAVWSNPSGNGSVESFSVNNWAVGDYFQFRTSSLGYSGISLSWDHTGSSTGPSSFSLLYSTDSGSNFTQYATYSIVRAPGSGQPNSYIFSDGSTGTSWTSAKTATNTYYSLDFSSITGLNSNSDIVFRISNLSSGVASSGTSRVDNVIITASAPVPEPSTGALLVLGGAALVAVRSFRKKNS